MILLFLVTCPLIWKIHKMFSKMQRVWHQFESRKMCIYGIFGTILRFIVLTEGKTLDHKKIEALVKMLMPKTPQEIQFLLGTLLQFMVLLGFLVVKYPKVTSVKVTTMSIQTSHFGHVQCNQAIKLNLVILACRMINKMTNYLTGSILYLN